MRTERTSTLNIYTAKLAELQDKIGDQDVEFWYRGQRDAGWPLVSGAIQRIVGKSIKAEEFVDYHKELIGYHKDLLELAKSIGGNQDSKGRELGDLELLAKLQHYGAATCLLDMTSNFSIAIWFACQEAEGQEQNDIGEDGKVFIVPMNPANTQVDLFKVRPDELGKAIDYFLNPGNPRREIEEQNSRRVGNKKPILWYWEPRPLMDRMLNQASRFIISPYDIPKKENLYFEIVIKAEHKESLLLELKQQQGLRPQNVFSDIPGLASINARGIPYRSKYSEIYLWASKRKAQEGDFENAIKDLDRANKLEPNNPSILLARGGALMQWTSYDAVQLGKEKLQKILDKAQNDLERARDLARETGEKELRDQAGEKLKELDVWRGVLDDFLDELKQEYRTVL